MRFFRKSLSAIPVQQDGKYAGTAMQTAGTELLSAWSLQFVLELRKTGIDVNINMVLDGGHAEKSVWL